MTLARNNPAASIANAAKLYAQGQLAAAANATQRLLQANPNDTTALSLMGAIESQSGRPTQAIVHLRRVVDLQPASADAQFNLACAYHQHNDIPAAEACYKQAIRLQPALAKSHINLGNLYSSQGQWLQARHHLGLAVNLEPEKEASALQLENIYRRLGAMSDQEALTAASTKRWPDNAVHWLHRAEALFALGRLDEAWTCYDWRFKSSPNPVISRAVEKLPQWHGGDVTAKSVLVWTEQGPGDEIMFGTLIPDIQSRVRKLGVLCSARLAPVLRRSFPNLDVFAESVPAEALKSFDVQSTIVAFAKLLRPSLGSFTASRPYLAADRTLAGQLRTKYQAGCDDLLIGIAWRSSGVAEAVDKTVPLGQWGALFAMPSVRFVSLQYGDCLGELNAIAADFGATVTHDASIDPMRDLDAYAAQVAAMDLVICSSNTAAHVAGALGVTTHCMLPETVGQGRRWYWLENAGGCVWYPSLKPWTRRAGEGWVEVIRDVALAVADHLVAANRAQRVPEFLLSLVAGYRKTDRPVDALAVLKVLAAFPEHRPSALLELASAALSAGRHDEAHQFVDQALVARKEFPEALNVKGMIFAARGQFAAAEQYYRQAIDSAADMPAPLHNLGTALRKQGRGLEADVYYRRADQLLPNHFPILNNLATNLLEINQPAEAVKIYDRLLALNPNYADAHFDRGYALLTMGEMAEGWRELAWRHRVHKNDERPSEERVPVWHNQSLSERSALVWTEQGVGDEILMASMILDAAAVVKKFVFACSTRLVPLFRRSFPSVEIIDRNGIHNLASGSYDFQLSLSELGALTRATLGQFPHRRSFLRAADQDMQRLRTSYQKQGPGQRLVGVSWRSANYDLGNLKSLKLQDLIPVIARPDLAAVNLQYGVRSDEISTAKATPGITFINDDSVDPIADLDLFAAQVAAMDVVVTTSNTTAHVAGALGVPTLLLLPFGRGRHWYWLRASEACPWYPSVTYFYQSADGSWDGALADLQEALGRNPGNTDSPRDKK